LLYRTLVMLTDGSMVMLVPWVAATVVVEAVMDGAEIIAAARWWRSRSERDERTALRLGAAVALFHALRVLVFVLGRTGPWPDFDVRPGYRATDASRWSWFSVIFAGTLSVAGVLVVIAVAWIRRRRRRGRAVEAWR
jgi:ABC-type Fe3+ transport system permease subunit